MDFIQTMPFKALTGQTVAVSASTTSGGTAVLINVQATDRQRLRSVRVASPSTNAVAFIDFGGSGVTASVPGASNGSMAVLPGTAVTFWGLDGPYMAAITSSSTATLYVTPGEGYS